MAVSQWETTGYKKLFFNNSVDAYMTLGTKHFNVSKVDVGSGLAPINTSLSDYYVYDLQIPANFKVYNSASELFSGTDLADATRYFTLQQLTNGSISVRYTGTGSNDNNALSLSFKVQKGNPVDGTVETVTLDLFTGSISPIWTIGGNKLVESNISDGDFYITDTHWSNSLTVTCEHSDGTTFNESVTVNTSDIVNAISATITIPDPPAGDLTISVNDLADVSRTMNSGNLGDYDLFEFSQLDSTADNRMTVSKITLSSEYSGHFNIPMMPYTTIYQYSASQGGQVVSSSRFQRSAENILVRINNLPQLQVNTGIPLMQVSETVTIGNTALKYIDNTNAVLTYTVTQKPTTGNLKLSNTVLNDNETFTQDNIDNSLLTFESSTSGGAFSFSFSLSDGIMANPITSSFSITINNAPNLQALTSVTVTENSSVTISTANLNFTDSDNITSEIEYTITQINDSNKGTLRSSGAMLAVDDVFTQSDIDNNLIIYHASGDQDNVAGSMNDLFKFTVKDVNGSAASPEQTMSIVRTSTSDMPSKASGLISVQVVENIPSVILNTHINAVDPDNVATSDDFVWKFVSTTTGKLEKDSGGGNWVELTTNSTFTQTELNDGKIRYNPSSGFNGTAILTLKLTDGNPATYTSNITFSVKVSSSAGTIMLKNYVLNVQEDTVDNIITSDKLLANDDDNTTPSLVYTLTSLTNINGVLKNNGTTLAVNDTFTQGDINGSLIKYTPTTNFDSTAGFSFTVGETAGGVQSSVQEFAIIVTNVGNAPVVVNHSQTINEDKPSVITSSGLHITDTNSLNSNITVKLKNLTNLNGTLELENLNTSNTLGVDSTFTVQDIHDGYIRYTPNLNFNTSLVGNQSVFEFEVYDEDNDYAESGGSTTFTFMFTVSAVNDLPSISLGNIIEFNVESGPVTITTSNITSSDVDGVGDLHYDITKYVIISAPSNGKITVARGGSNVELTSMTSVSSINSTNYFTQSELETGNVVKYTSDANFFGQDTFTVKLKDASVSQAEFESNTLNPLTTLIINVKSIYDDLTITINNMSLNEDVGPTSIYPNLTITDGTGIITYVINNVGNLNGYLRKTVNGVTSVLTNNDSFTQADLASNNVKYEPLNNFNGSSSFTFSATDESVPVKDVVNKTLRFTVASVNDSLIQVQNDGLILNEDTTASLTGTLEFREVFIEGGETTHVVAPNESNATNIEYTLTNINNLNGVLKNAGVTLNTHIDGVCTLTNAGQKHFTQDDLNGNGSTITYVPGANWNGNASFQFNVNDSNGGTPHTNVTYSITVNHVWDNVLITNNGMTLNEDAGLTSITSAMLEAKSVAGPDGNDAPSQASPGEITFTLNSLTNLNGILKNGANTLAVNGTFTQQDINDGNLKYEPNADYNNRNSSGNKNLDGDNNIVIAKADFEFSVNASNQYGSDTSLNHVFYIDVLEQNDVPISNVFITMPIVEDVATTVTNSYLEYVEKQYNNTLAPNESNNANITFTITNIDNLNGNLKNQTTVLNTTTNKTFTQDDINTGKIIYTPGNHFNGSSTFLFNVRDHSNNLSVTPNTGGTQTFTFNVTSVNDNPLVLVPNNNGLSINEDSITVITNGDLMATEVKYNSSLAPSESSPNNLTFTLTSDANLNGKIKKFNTGTSTWQDINLNGTWTQTDINNNHIMYYPTLHYNGAASFIFSVTDNNGGSLINQTFSITVTTVNDGPILSINNTTVTTEGQSVFIKSSDLQTVEVKLGTDNNANVDGSDKAVNESNPVNITYTINNVGYLNGNIHSVNGGTATSLSAGDTFTQAEINSGSIIRYTPNYFNVNSDSNYFEFTVTDLNGLSTSSKKYFRVYSINDLPTSVNNTGLNVSRKSQDNIITDVMLRYTKTPVMNNLMTYTLTNIDELNGTLRNNNVAIGLNGTFTQQDINSNLVKYTSNANFTGWSKFSFKVTHQGDHQNVNGVFNIVVNSRTNGGGAGGDPYIQPVNGTLYKIPVDSNSYRMFDNLGIAKKGEEVIINAKMDLLYTGDKEMADENRGKWEEYMNNNEKTYVTDAESFIRYLYINIEGQDHCIDLENLTFVEQPENMSLDKAVISRNTVISKKELKDIVIKKDIEEKSKFWGKTFPIYKDVRGDSLKIGFNTKTHGVIVISIMSFTQLQEFRTSIQINSEKPINQSNANGLLVAKTKKGQIKNFTNTSINKKMFFSNGGKVKEDKITLFTSIGMMEHSFRYVQ